MSAEIPLEKTLYHAPSKHPHQSVPLATSGIAGPEHQGSRLGSPAFQREPVVGKSQRFTSSSPSSDDAVLIEQNPLTAANVDADGPQAINHIQHVRIIFFTQMFSN